MKLSLGSKIATLFSIGLAIVTLILTSLFASEVNRRYRDLFIERGKHTVNEVLLKTEHLLELGLYPHELMGYDKLLNDTLNNTEGMIYLAFLGRDRTPHFEAGLLPKELLDLSEFGPNSISLFDKNAFIIQRPITARPQQVGSIVAILDKTLIDSKTMEFVRTTLSYALITSFIAIFIVILYLRSNLGGPLKQLVARIKRVELSKINREKDPLVKRTDEIGVVARTFESMLYRLSLNQAYLAQTNEELKILAYELESRVDERTQELEEVNKQLQSLAHLDMLTGLLNRHCLEDVLEPRFEKAKRNHHLFALLMMDLDRFKVINDRFGHLAGDETLSVIGKRIRHALRYGDRVFRYGGDEFVFIFEDYPDHASLITIVEKIIEVVSQPVIFEGIELTFGVSIGIASSDHCVTCTAEQLLVHADEAMYEAKNNKLDYVVSKYICV